MNCISQNAKIYNNVRIVDSEIEDFALVADNCDLVCVKMAPHSEFGRRNIVRDCEINYGSYTGQNSTIKSAIIGKYCCISSDVNIYGGETHNYEHVSLYTSYWYNKTFNAEINPEKSINQTNIGNDVWIGCDVTILGGLKIGDGSVIGAGAVVTKDIEPYTIVVGNPAKKIKMRFPEDVIAELMEIKWWDLPPEVLSKNVDLLNHKIDDTVLQDLKRLKSENF